MKRLLRKLHVCLQSVAILAWVAAATPYAQAPPSARPADASQARSQAKQGIEEIIVTAQKREESIQKVPISLTAIEGENLHFRGVEDLTDLQFQVPGLHYGNDTGAGQQVAIRGVSLTNADAFIEAPVATYVDGIYQVRSFRSPTLGIDLKRIEVLRGPQGTLFGRNATGGALNIVLEEPTDEFHGKFRTGVGSYGLAKVEGVTSGPLIKGLLSGRLAGAFEHYGGAVENV